MAINWFEGGRRISYIFMGLVAASGAAYVIWTEEPDPILVSRGPSMPLFVSSAPCPDEWAVTYLWDYDWGGEKPGLRMCFTPLPNGSFPYAIAPTPPEEIERQQAEEHENQKRIERGELPIPIVGKPWFYGASEYSMEFVQYKKKAIANLEITPELRETLEASRSNLKRDKRNEAFAEAVPWVAGMCAFIWAFTFAMGWIVRGFAGVPRGQDFRSPRTDS